MFVAGVGVRARDSVGGYISKQDYNNTINYYKIKWKRKRIIILVVVVIYCNEKIII